MYSSNRICVLVVLDYFQDTMFAYLLLCKIINILKGVEPLFDIYSCFQTFITKRYINFLQFIPTARKPLLKLGK